MRHRYRLTPEIEQQITGLIRAGAYAWVAAEAAGVPRKTFRHWMRAGAKTARQPYRRFYLEVMQSLAMARVRVEIEVREKDPRFWLRHGPGREAPTQPGWTNPVKPAVSRKKQRINPLASPQWSKLWAVILKTLSSFPEARQALIQALADFEKDVRKMPSKDGSSGENRAEGQILREPNDPDCENAHKDV